MFSASMSSYSKKLAAIAACYVRLIIGDGDIAAAEVELCRLVGRDTSGQQRDDERQCEQSDKQVAFHSDIPLHSALP